MRFALVAMLAGCAFHAHATADGGGGSGALIDDTATDFQAGANLDGAVIDRLGLVEPEAYVLGGLRARAYDGKYVSGTTTSWADIDNATAGAMLRGVAYQQLPADWTNKHPTGLGLSADMMPDDNFTVVYDGELYLTAGAHQIAIDADDAGAVELGQMFVVDATAGAKTLDVNIDAAAWVPIRLAIGEGTGNASLAATLDGNAIPARQTRARVTDDQGLLTYIYDAANNTEAQAGPVLATPNVNWGMTAPPFDLPGVPTVYTARMMGQLRIDHDGTYTLATATGSTDDTTALYIDGHEVAQTNGFTPTFPATATLMLTAGWHGIVVEVGGTQTGPLGNSDPHAVTLATTIAEGSGPAMPVTADMLRPAAMSGYFSLAFSALTPLADANGATNGITMLAVPATVPTQPIGAVIDSALYGYFFRHATPSDYAVSLDELGMTKALPTRAFLLVYGGEAEAGMPVPTTTGAWTFTFADSVPGNAANQPDPGAFGVVVLTTHGGPQMPFAPTWTYTSGPRALGDGVIGWGALNVTGALAGASLAISVRAAPIADDLPNAPWVDVANGAVPVLPPNPYVEYRIAVTSDGWRFPAIDKVRLDYTR